MNKNADTIAALRIETPPATLREIALERMRRAIISGLFEPGARLVERTLCDQLGVSRSVIREVIRHLEAEGLVEMLAKQGPIVARLEWDDARQIYEIRAALEATAVADCARVADETDAATGIPVISLYGPKNKPSKEDLADVDIMVYDLQDVGVRFYTNINALVRLMDACHDNNKPLLILDRPNPNGYLIDGPILDMKYKSGIGMFPIPIAHGLTIGEFARMANGEGWLINKAKCDITIIPVANYAHDMPYILPVKPSPNLNTQQAVMLYPSTCLFEGIYLNHGRGTYYPFTMIGSPELKGVYDFCFTPTGIKGMAETPLFADQPCYGLDLRHYDVEQLRKKGQINLQWIIELYKNHPHKEKFFDSKLSREMGTIETRVGTGDFRQQIINGVSEEDIRKSWEPGLSQYKEMRKKYLLYP